MNYDIGMIWSSNGQLPSDEYKCTQIIEPIEPVSTTWSDNYLCVPKDSKWTFTWNSVTPADTSNCVHIYENLDTSSWDNNYLCVYYDIDQSGV